MQVKKSQLTPTRVALNFTAHEADLEPFKKAALRSLGANLKLAGFRSGKAPLSVIEKNLDPNAVQSEVMEQAINHFYAELVRKENLRPVAQPDVKIQKFVPFTMLEVTIDVDVIGKITLPDYKKIRLAKPKVTITAAEVTNVVNSLRERAGARQDVDRAAKNGDNVVIDFKGSDAKGKPVSGADGKDYPLILGSNQFIPGFEDELVGLKPGASKTFKITFPKDYGVSMLANQKVTFEVTVNKVQSIELPKVDDAFAATVGPFKTLAELKADIKKQLALDRQQAADRDYQNRLLEDITNKSKLDVPQVLIEEQLDAGEREERQNLMYRGQTWEEHLEAEGVTEKEHREKNRESATLRVKAGLVLSEISNQEGIKVSPEDLRVRLELLKGQYSDEAMRAELEKPENQQDVAMRLLSEKTIEQLVKYANRK